MIKFTMQPFVAKKSPKEDGAHWVYAGDRKIADCYGEDNIPQIERDANATLFAAAPHLLEIARRALDFVRVTPQARLVHTREDIERWLREAIAKAEGRKS